MQSRFGYAVMRDNRTITYGLHTTANTTKPPVAVVVPVHNHLPLTLSFLDSFGQVRYPNYLLIVVDDGSTDGTAEAMAKQYPQVVRLQGDGNLWWAGAVNRGVRHALAEGFQYVLTINNDTSVSPDFLDQLVETAERYPRSIVGARINIMDEPERIWAVGGLVQWSSGVLLQLRCCGLREKEVLVTLPDPCPADVLTGCGTLVPTDCYREVGLYDERWLPQYHGDSEFVLRARRRGYQPLVALRAVIWNNARVTCTSPNLFSRRSPWYWRPVFAILFRYCPWRYIPSLLIRHYGHALGTIRAGRTVG